MRAEPGPLVTNWIAARPASSLFATTVTQAEILYGEALLPAGKRRDCLSLAVDDLFEQDFTDRLLPFDEAAAWEFADIAFSRRRRGLPINQFDAQIAAITKSRGAALATRDVADFLHCGLTVIDPWIEKIPGSRNRKGGLAVPLPLRGADLLGPASVGWSGARAGRGVAGPRSLLCSMEKLRERDPTLISEPTQ